jgi:hypothetical protein
VLRQAGAAIAATGKEVKIDTAIVRGDPITVFLTESRKAELVCIGSVGVGTVSRRLVGSTAAALAEGAHCPVAIIRDHGENQRTDCRWIAVAVKASTVDEDIVVTAMEEARLRHAPVLAIGLWQEDLRQPAVSSAGQVDRLRAFHRFRI